MIGNDIIDLALAHQESNWQRKGFLSKIFTEREQCLIVKAHLPEIMVWDLWSRKEAAYKIYNRETGIRAFIPHQLECYEAANEDDSKYGIVTCFGQTYYTKTQMTASYIETVAVLHQDDFHKIVTLTPDQKVYKSNGIPYCLNRQQVPIPVSVSHHGRFERRITLSE